MIRRRIFESNEEKAKRDKESEESQKRHEEWGISLKKHLEEIKEYPLVKYALKVLDEQYNGAGSEYKDKARKIAEYIKKKKKSHLETSKELASLQRSIVHLAEMSDSKIDNFPEEDDPPEYEDIRAEARRIPTATDLKLRALITKTAVEQPTQKKTHFPENDRLRKFAKEISEYSDYHYNNHLISENPKFTTDDDPKATPATFFSLKRVTEFIRTLADSQMRYHYLLQTEQALLDKNERGFISRNGEKVFLADEDLPLKLRSQINLYERVLIKHSDFNQKEITEDKNLKNPEFTTTRQVLALRYLLKYAKVKETEKNLPQKNFIHFLTGKDKSSIGKKFDDETLAYNKDGDDLLFVRQHFIDLGLPEIVRLIDNDSI